MTRTTLPETDCLYPDDFLWGTATAAYQIEGAAAEDGRGPSNWDVFCKRPGAVFEGHTGEVACDHYHRYREDIALMRELGVQTYRFSVSWSRVLPEGRGAINGRGLDFYASADRRAARGAASSRSARSSTGTCRKRCSSAAGFVNRDIAYWFADYAALIGERLGDRVKLWVTQNEPQCFIGHGLVNGQHAPGLRLDFSDTLHAAHNSLRAHGKAVSALRATAKGARDRLRDRHRRDAPRDRLGSRPRSRARGDVVDPRSHALEQHLVVRPGAARPLPRGRPAPLRQRDAALSRAPTSTRSSQPLDFLGINVYKADTFRRGDDGKPEAVPFPPGYPRSGVEWQPITPDAHYYCPRFFHERYGVPLYDHRERALHARSGRARRQGPRPAAHRLHAALSARTAPRHARRRRREGLSTPGRCSTTSSGTRATSSASASCTSTIRPSAASRRTRSTGMPA